MENTKKTTANQNANAAKEQTAQAKQSRLEKVIGSMTKIATLQSGKGHR